MKTWTPGSSRGEALLDRLLSYQVALYAGRSTTEALMAAKKRTVGKNGPEVLPIGLGCMSLSGVYGPSDEAAGERFIQQAVDLGVDFLDSSDMYGWGQNESLL